MTSPALLALASPERDTESQPGRDHYAANWPHLAEFLVAMREAGHPTTKMCQALGITPANFDMQRHNGRVSFAVLRAMVEKFGGPHWAGKLRDSATVTHVKRGFALAPEVDRFARRFDAEHRSWMYVMEGGGYFEPIAESYGPLALEPIDTADAGGNAAPPVPENTDSQRTSPAGEVSASSPSLVASPLPVGEPLGEVDAMVMIAAKLIRERDNYAAQLTVQRTRLEQETAAVRRELEAARQTIAAKDAEIAKLTADIVEWQQLAEREPEPVEQRPVNPTATATLTAAIERAPGLNGERLGLFEELNQLPKFPGHGG